MGYAKINDVVFNCYSYYPPAEDKVTLNLIGTTMDKIDEAIHAGPGTIDVDGDYMLYGYNEPVSIKKYYDELEILEVTIKKPDLETIAKRNAVDIEVINGAIAELAELIPEVSES